MANNGLREAVRAISEIQDKYYKWFKGIEEWKTKTLDVQLANLDQRVTQAHSRMDALVERLTATQTMFNEERTLVQDRISEFWKEVQNLKERASDTTSIQGQVNEIRQSIVKMNVDALTTKDRIKNLACLIETSKEKECNHVDMVNNVLTKRIEDIQKNVDEAAATVVGLERSMTEAEKRYHATSGVMGQIEATVNELKENTKVLMVDPGQVNEEEEEEEERTTTTTTTTVAQALKEVHKKLRDLGVGGKTIPVCDDLSEGDIKLLQNDIKAYQGLNAYVARHQTDELKKELSDITTRLAKVEIQCSSLVYNKKLGRLFRKVNAIENWINEIPDLYKDED
jgi:chromosome segregation ATPase